MGILTLQVCLCACSSSLQHPQSILLGRYSAPEAGSLTLLGYSICVTLLAIPFTIFTNRAMVTPNRLPWTNPSVAWRILLTGKEQRRPWNLYLIPGLLLCQFLHIFFVVLILHNLRRLIIPSWSPRTGHFEDLS